MRAFFEHLSVEWRQKRFFSLAVPRGAWLEAVCDASNPRRQLSLLVTRVVGGAARVIAVGSYLADTDTADTAEVALAVDDACHGMGLGSLLLEHLALLASRHGLTRFWVVTHADNRPMLEVFHRSGFQVQEQLDHGDVHLGLSLRPTEASVARSELLDRLFTTASLRPLFQPTAVAVVGASRDPSSLGFQILEALVMNRFQGPVYPVNPRAHVVGSIRAYPSVRDLPEPVDLAVLAVPRHAVLKVVDECAARGVKALVVITAGFAEVDAEGRALQQTLVDKVRGYGMRLVGPNCLGVLNTDPAVRLNASFSPIFPPPGWMALSSQSGALGLAILALARQLNLGLSTFISVGNKADVSGNDLLQYWEEDKHTDVILLYLESFGNPRRFSRIAPRVSRRQPIVAVKSGRTPAGGRAAGSPTAALAAREVAVEALFRQTDVIRADTLAEMFDLAVVLGSQPLPKGRRVAIVTNAGEPGQSRGSARFGRPRALSPGHRGAAGRRRGRRAGGHLHPRGYLPTAADPRRHRHRGSGAAKLVLACLMVEEESSVSLQIGTEKIPTFGFPEAAARVLGKVAEYAQWRARPGTRSRWRRRAVSRWR